MPILKIVLNIDDQEALCCLAEQELREPHAQAVLLIRKGLKSCGLLTNIDRVTDMNHSENLRANDESN